MSDTTQLLPATIDLGAPAITDPAASHQLEWLVTNGIGGYASGTVGGALTRRYHGLLVAALRPPLGRTVLLSKLDDSASYLGKSYPLFSNRWQNRTSAPTPQGFRWLTRFHLEGSTPVWTWQLADAVLEKRVWLVPGENTTVVRYTLAHASAPLDLSLKALVTHRDFHSLTRPGNVTLHVDPYRDGVVVTAGEGSTPFVLLSDTATVEPRNIWYYDLFLDVEDYRGFPPLTDNLLAANVSATLRPGESVALIASTNPDVPTDAGAAWQARTAHDAALLVRASDGDDTDWIRQLVLAADQFIVERAVPGEAEPGRSVIAGYHWFGDWGRDTMIALPGLTLTTGRSADAARILRTFAGFVDRGMLPNRWPDQGETPEYNTVDATLWYIEAIRAYLAHTGDTDLLAALFAVLESIVDWHQRGTRYNIHMDPADSLIYAGEAGVQLTWMDAKVDDWVVTPRIGKPVEVNALWYNALRSMAGFAATLGKPASDYDALADRVATSMQHYWRDDLGHLIDVLDGPSGDDARLRPNQLFAASLHHSAFDVARQRAIVDTCARHLLTPAGLRSLAPSAPGYIGRYGGNVRARDGAYHQGTTWGWLIGPFVAAHHRVYNDPAAAADYLRPFAQHLRTHCAGNLAEIFDGDAPFSPRGAIAQAWTVAEVLRVWHLTQQETS